MLAGGGRIPSADVLGAHARRASAGSAPADYGSGDASPARRGAHSCSWQPSQ
jgi:hypothetical protein